MSDTDAAVIAAIEAAYKALRNYTASVTDRPVFELERNAIRERIVDALPRLLELARDGLLIDRIVNIIAIQRNVVPMSDDAKAQLLWAIEMIQHERRSDSGPMRGDGEDVGG